MKEAPRKVEYLNGSVVSIFDNLEDDEEILDDQDLTVDSNYEMNENLNLDDFSDDDDDDDADNANANENQYDDDNDGILQIIILLM